jgi:DNA-binding CsgD family transcriptional regulator/N-acetylneuraminic acid mutarotase
MQNDLPVSTTSELTEREREILKLLATGTSNKDIAQQLFISSNTVKVHLRNIFAKIGATSRTEAAVYAIREGISQTVQLPGGEPAVNPVPIDTKIKPLIFWISILVTALLAGAATLIWMRSQTPKVSATGPAPVAPQRWQKLASLPTARSGLAVAVYENQIYAIGGETAQGVTGIMEQYDLATDKWLKLTSKPAAVTEIHAAVIGGKIYIPGGRLASGSMTDLLESYDPSQNLWKKLVPLPVALSRYALVAFEGKMYIFGGWDGQKFLASVYEYDPSQDKWLERTPMPTARADAGAGVAGGKIYVFGGFNGKAALAVNEEYLPDRDTWSERVPLPAGRYAMGATSLADLIYVVGGVGGTDSAMPPLQYSFQPDQWQTFEDPLLRQWSYLGLVPIQTKLYALGGLRNGLPDAQNLSYQAIYTIVIPFIP